MGSAPETVPPPGEAYTVSLPWQGRRVVRTLPIEAEEAAVLTDWLTIVNETGVRYAVGGGYAFHAFTGIWRTTKDLDVFVRPADLKAVLDALRRHGFETEVRDRLWLAKAHREPFLLDLLFSVRHCTPLDITEGWFRSCRPALFLGVPTCLLGVEEMIASKIYVAARDRFDGPDILHLVQAVDGRVDWEHVVDLLGGDEEIVLWHLLLLQFVYPGRPDYLPQALMERAFERARAGWRSHPGRHVLRGRLIDPDAFAYDVEERGLEDCRDLRPLVGDDGALSEPAGHEDEGIATGEAA